MFNFIFFQVLVQFKVVDDNGDPVEGAKVVINGDPEVITNADGEIPPTPALPCATELAYVIDGPLDPVTNLPKFQQVQDTFTVAKTSAPEVEVIISLVPVPAVRIYHLKVNLF